MNTRINNRNAGWGTLLIALGSVALVDTIPISEWYKVPIFVIAGLAAFVFYFQDRTNWLALIPVYILWSGALISLAILIDVVNDDIIAVAVLPLIAIPFLYVYFKDRKKWWALIPAYILLLIAFIMLGVEVLGFDDEIFALALMPGFAVPFLYVYFKNRQRWWALIPAYVFLLVGLLITLDEVFRLGEAVIGPGILIGIGLPFLYVYFHNRKNWWALIPSYVMIAIGFLVGLLGFDLLKGLAIPAYVMLAVAVPFFFVYISNDERNWALIPGGITGVIGLGFLFWTDVGRYLVPAILVLGGIWLLARVISKR